MIRTTDAETVSNAMAQKPEIHLDVDDWLTSGLNVAFAEDDSVGLFQYEYPGLYTGHYFFSPSVRGKKAKELATDMLAGIFDLGAEAVRGLSPLQNLGARWMTRQLGFKSYGVLSMPTGPVEIFVLTRDQFRNR